MPLLDSLLAGLHQANQEEAGSFRLVEAEELLSPEELGAEFLDLRHCGHPLKMTRDECHRQILLPSLRAGDIPGGSEEDLAAEVAAMPEEAVQEWAAEVLKANPWPPGFHLPSFFEFVTSADYLNDVPPTPKQRAAIEDSIGVDARAWFVEPRRLSTIILCWGKGCLSESETLTDYASGQTRTVKEWAERGEGLLVPSWDGQRLVLMPASPVYRKGRAELFQVRLEDGREFQATGFHRCLTDQGWRRVEELLPGQSQVLTQPLAAMSQSGGSTPCRTGRAGEGPSVESSALNSLPGSSGMLNGLLGTDGLVGSHVSRLPHSDCLATRPACAPRGNHKLSGAAGHCSPSEHPHGVRPRKGVGSDLILVPSPTGVLGHTRTSSHGDASAARAGYIRTCPASSRHSEDASLPGNLGDAVARLLQAGSAAQSQPRIPAPPLSLDPSSPSGTVPSPGVSQSESCSNHPSVSPPDALPQYSRVVSIEPVGEGDFYDLTVPGTHCYFDAQGVLHHNSGKDLLSGWVCAYVSWSVAYMRNPWFHFNMPTGEVLDIVNVAQDQDSARGVFFQKLRNNVQKACFGQLLEPEDIKADAIVFRKFVPGELFTRICVRINSLHSRNEKAEGRNTFLYIMDEADAMRDAKGHGNARKMFNTLATSNRFGSRQLGIIISYPRSRNGFMFETLNKCGNLGGKTVEWWGDLSPTYRILPWKCYQPLLVDGQQRWTNPTGYISSEPDLEMARLYRDDPELFRAMYEADPPAAEDAFISQSNRIDECISPLLKAIATVDTTVHSERDTTTGQVFHYAALALSKITMRKGVVYYIGGDAGADHDSFALCISHVVPPNEVGFISPDAWRDSRLRLSKHYRPEPFPTYDPAWRPEHWRCDHTGQIPVPGKHQFWGVCRPTGKPIQRQVKIGEDQEGNPIYAKDHLGQDVVQDAYLPRVVQDLLLEWRPNKAKGLTVDFRNVKEIILELARHGTIGYCYFDKWQAIQMVQELRSHGIACETKAFGSAAQLEWYRNYKALLYNHCVELLPGEERARRQLRELQLLNGIRIDHPQYSSGGGVGGKDLTDAEALSFWLCCSPQFAPARIDTGSTPAVAGMNQQAIQAERRKTSELGIVAQTLRGLGI